ncbi:hypothetical protein CEXT_604581 [Caerostris extrusa]|uniref:Uncharacterized protein n=1 Tax=Caerostris extrusa TaxID=172846 RepID=A0AAV4M404_CAEEX|nr:hypothetical protein CEXT_604581 [Caerostris extrusa]
MGFHSLLSPSSVLRSGIKGLNKGREMSQRGVWGREGDWNYFDVNIDKNISIVVFGENVWPLKLIPDTLPVSAEKKLDRSQVSQKN